MQDQHVHAEIVHSLEIDLQAGNFGLSPFQVPEVSGLYPHGGKGPPDVIVGGHVGRISV